MPGAKQSPTNGRILPTSVKRCFQNSTSLGSVGTDGYHRVRKPSVQRHPPRSAPFSLGIRSL